MECSHAGHVPCQWKTTATWPDGSVRWLSVTWLADVAAGSSAEYLLVPHDENEEHPSSAPGIVADRSADDLVLEANRTRCLFAASGTTLMRELKQAGESVLAKRALRLIATGAEGQSSEGVVEGMSLGDVGPVFAVAHFRGHFPRQHELRFFGHFKLFANGGLRLEITLHNPRRARRQGGYWELGDPGSIMLKEVAISVHLARGLGELQWREEPFGAQFHTAGNWKLYQESSGGQQWQSPTHVDRSGQIPLQQRGYKVEFDSQRRAGQQCSPTLVVRGKAQSLSVGLPEFWQKFPTAVARAGDKLRIGILPREFPVLHELQAGEQLTRTLWLSADEAEGESNLEWCHEPLTATIDPQVIQASDAIPFFPNTEQTARPELRDVLEHVVEGPSSFFAKREPIDEYGWRNYGELWADHEGAYHNAAGEQVISHFNNQYDPLHGMLMQFLLTGDQRWWRLADALARHIMDVDIYHTVRDKSAYNHGLFWHTDHYFAAGKATHRSFATTMDLDGRRSHGGGPGNEQAYNSGLALYYFLTDDGRARDAALGLADWLIAADDGARHLLGVASSAPTGAASATCLPDYHGPGRGAGNAIHVLLEAWLLSGGEQYREFAETLIRRTIHPHDDVEARDLLNFEIRWSYTVYLQTLARYLELARQFPVEPSMIPYVRESLLAYARWMTDHETLYLDHAEKLEYPTETWAAQDLRKANVLGLAARHAAADEADRFLEAGRRLADGAWRQLIEFPTRTFTRPAALVLQQGYIETFLSGEEGRRRVSDLAPATTAGFAEPEPFVTQKQDIRQKLKRPAGWMALAGCLVRPARWRNAWRQTWPAERLRRKK